MSVATANGAPIESMRLVLPPRGVWTAELAVDAEAPPAAGDEVVIELEGARFTGTATLPGVDGNGKVTVAVSGGAAKLTTILPPKNFGPTTVETVLRELLATAGEHGAATISTATRTRPLSRWGRTRQSGKSALNALADEIGATWRVLDDGTVWIGTDTGEDAGLEERADYDVVEERAEKDVLDLALETLALRPGQTFRGGPVARVEYRLTGVRLTATISRIGAPARDRKTDAKVQKAMAPTRWHPPRAARVVSQNADGTLELAMEVPPGKEAEIGSLEKVPIRHAIDGVVDMRVLPGTRAVVFFEGGDPKAPFAALWLAGGRLLSWKLAAERVEIGGAEAVALAAKTDDRFAALESRVLALEAWGGGVTPAFPGGPGSGGDSVASEVLFTK